VPSACISNTEFHNEPETKINCFKAQYFSFLSDLTNSTIKFSKEVILELPKPGFSLDLIYSIKRNSKFGYSPIDFDGDDPACQFVRVQISVGSIILSRKPGFPSKWE
jgi:hypothetical protein